MQSRVLILQLWKHIKSQDCMELWLGWTQRVRNMHICRCTLTHSWGCTILGLTSVHIVPIHQPQTNILSTPRCCCLAKVSSSNILKEINPLLNWSLQMSQWPSIHNNSTKNISVKPKYSLYGRHLPWTVGILNCCILNFPCEMVSVCIVYVNVFE